MINTDKLRGIIAENGLSQKDVAKAIVYLAEAEFITGEVLSVNGGLII